MFDSVAAIGIILGTAWFGYVPEPTKVNKETVTVSYMTDVHNTEWDFSLTKAKSVVDVSYQSKPTSFYGLRYGASAMLNGQGTYMFGPGIGKTIDVNGFDLTLFIYPSYSAIKGDDRLHALSRHCKPLVMQFQGRHFPLDLLGAGPIIREALNHGMVLHG